MLTIENWLKGLDCTQPPEECPVWPPDLYAIAGALLKRSGAYLHVFKHDGTSDYLDGIRETGVIWRRSIEKLRQPVTLAGFRSARPKDIQTSWKYLVGARKTPISEIRGSEDLTQHLIRMALIADEACAGIGVDWDRTAEKGPSCSTFLSFAEAVLSGNALRSFCWDISVDVIGVLGKQHTPQRGATFRSLTHHLALYLPNDVEARWIHPFPKTANAMSRSSGLNLLLLPWPVTIETDDFSETSREYFRFRPRSSPSPATFARQVEKAVKKARMHAGGIDAIVLPELAVSIDQYLAAERVAMRERAVLIAGMRLEAKTPRHRDLNLSVIQPVGSLRGRKENLKSARGARLVDDLRCIQAKHHRWCLDHDQIVNYQLAGRLPASRNAWENIELPPRVLHFVTLNRMTWSVLVCEDLARQDPAAELIRAVGPNLLVALLMDGPQLSGRWPSRYASVLAEDPGTSVLTLTSLGMAERSRPLLRGTAKRADRSRVVALWRDATAGEIEIELDPGDDACVLSLECRMVEEFCADGRGDGGGTTCPVFAGYRSFRTAA
jgi:hypothetical protein